jgi:uncharacterized metal-binding protein YceD (DUF177 family)
MKTPQGQNGPLSFSRPLKVEEVRDKKLDLEISANAAECAALAQQTGVPAILDFRATLHVEPGRRGRFEVTGTIRAKLTQICVVTLEPFDSELSEEIEATFAPTEDAERAAARYAARPEETVSAPDEEDPPDPIINGRIDLGVLATEFFVLGLDPYQRKPGVEFQPELGHTTVPSDESPFAALARLKDKDSS